MTTSHYQLREVGIVPSRSLKSIFNPLLCFSLPMPRIGKGGSHAGHQQERLWSDLPWSSPPPPLASDRFHATLRQWSLPIHQGVGALSEDTQPRGLTNFMLRFLACKYLVKTIPQRPYLLMRSKANLQSFLDGWWTWIATTFQLVMKANVKTPLGHAKHSEPWRLLKSSHCAEISNLFSRRPRTPR